MISLAHKQVVKDSSRCAQGFADYIVTVRKPGNNPIPISRGVGFKEYIGERPLPKAKQTNIAKTNKFSQEIWQRYASPVWFDIRQTRVLTFRTARNEKDERHICPLQLDVVERCLELWSTEGDIVLDPFAGIGTTPYCSVKMGRKAIAFELKESYYNQTIKNMNRLKKEKKRRTIL
jgi:DNA modification methylase